MDLSQEKLYKLISDIKGIKTYIGDVLVLIKEIFYNHMDQVKVVFSRLCAAGLKFNAPKCSFWLKGIPYLGYVITRDGIKHYPNKLQGIVDLGRPTTITEALELVGMIQYYRDVCIRRSHILSSLTEASIGPKGVKYFVMIYYNIHLSNSSICSLLRIY